MKWISSDLSNQWAVGVRVRQVGVAVRGHARKHLRHEHAAEAQLHTLLPAAERKKKKNEEKKKKKKKKRGG